jgi:peptidoglycan/xylan/chitin deacetylase (PgdA/CDA1 family)
MHASGLIAFGAHTVDHVVLTQVDEARQRREIRQSLTDVADLTGAPCRLFAYPNGSAYDYDETAMAELREAGVTCAVTTRDGANTPDTPPLELRRIGIGNRIGPISFPLKLRGRVLNRRPFWR